MTRQGLIRMAGIAVCGVAVLLLAATMILRSGRFHRFILMQGVMRAQNALGNGIEIGDFSFHWQRMYLDVYGVTVHGTEPASVPPLLQADHIGIGLKLVSIWRHKIDLREIVLDHPVVHYLVDHKGRSNLSRPPSTESKTTVADVFNLAVGHFAVNRGELFDNDSERDFYASVRGLQASTSFESVKNAYTGSLNYRQGLIRYGDYEFLPHDLDLAFAAAPSGLTVNSLRLVSGASTIVAQINLQNYHAPFLKASYQASLSTRELATLMKTNSLPAGQVDTKGTVEFQSDSERPFADAISLQGELKSREMTFRFPQAHGEVQEVKANYKLQSGRLEIAELHMGALGGLVTGKVTIGNVSTNQNARIEASLKGVSLALVNNALTSKPLELKTLAGSLEGKITAGWSDHPSNLNVLADATITASSPLDKNSSSLNVIPIAGNVHAAYDGRDNTLNLRNTTLLTPYASLNLDGTFAKTSSLQIQAQASDLHALDVLALSYRRSAMPAGSPPLQLLGLEGSGVFEGQMQGTLEDPHLTGQINGTNIRYQRTAAEAVRATIDARPSMVALHQGRLQLSSNEIVQFDGSLALRKWKYDSNLPASLRLTAANISVSDLQRVSGFQYPVSGSISADLALRGSPASPSGQGSLRLANATIWQQPVQSVSLQFQGDGASIHTKINLRTTAGTGDFDISYLPREQAYKIQGNFPSIQLDKIVELQKRTEELSGRAKITVRGDGTLKRPRLETRVETPRLRMGNQNLDGLNLRATVADQIASVSADSTVSTASIHAEAKIALNKNYDTTAKIDTRTVQLGPLLSSFLHLPDGGLSGQTELHASLAGPLKDLDSVSAQLTLPTLRLNYQALYLQSTAPILANYHGGKLTINNANLKGTDTDLQMEAVIPITGGGPIQASATGNVDLRLLQGIHPDWSSSGQIKLNMNAEGTVAKPNFHGNVQIINGALQAPETPAGLENLNAKLDIQGDRVLIENLTARSGGGTINGQGFLTYKPVRFSLSMSAQDVRLRYPDGVRTVLQGNVTLAGTPASATLGGAIQIDRLSFTDSFDLAKFADQFSQTSSSAATGMEQNIKLSLSVNSAREMDLSTSGLNLAGTVNLQVRGSLEEPVILGRTEIHNGELFFNGRRYQVENAVIQFTNPVHTQAIVNALVNTTINQYNISARFFGPLDRMRTTYTSDPPLAPIDVINLLFTGQPSEASSSTPTTPQSVIAGQLAGQVSSRLGKMAGISALTIDPQIGGNGTNPGARLAIQERVTKNLFFTFATDVTSTQDALVQIEYQATKKYAVDALRDQNGGYSLQIKMRKKF